MKGIPLTQGKIAIIDDGDYHWLIQWKWCVNRDRGCFYAVRNIRTANGRRRLEQMHRLILGLQPGDKRQCDHRDGNGLNNQRSNLRVCTSQQNHRSSRKRKGCTSKYKGVHWDRRDRKWLSQIQLKEKRVHLGRFDSETDAAIAYDIMALEHHGVFAVTNKMLGLI